MLQDISAKPFGWCTENAQKGFSLWSPVLSISLIKPSLGRLSVYVGVCLCMCAWVHNSITQTIARVLFCVILLGEMSNCLDNWPILNIFALHTFTGFRHQRVHVFTSVYVLCKKQLCKLNFFLEGLFNICVLYVSYCLITLPSVLILDPGCRCVTIPHRFAIADYTIVWKYELLNENVNGMQMSGTSLTSCIAPQLLPKKSTRSKGRPLVK